MLNGASLMSSYAAECIRRIDVFINLISSLVARDISEGTPRLSVDDVLQLAQELASREGSCDVSTPLRHVYQTAAKLAVDKAMEALSMHMENLDEQSYAALSHIVTMYAFHVARLAASALELASMDKETVLEAFEPIVFASLARVMALARTVSSISPEDLTRLIPALEAVVTGYVAEENELVRGLVRLLTGEQR